MLDKLKEEVYKANLSIVNDGLVLYTWGNASGIDRDTNYVVIKPSGIPYEKMTKDDMVVVDLDGNIIEGNLKPSSDTKTHLEIYKKYQNVGGIVHTHSTWATIWAQSGRSIPAYGTTHADNFYGQIKCTRKLTEKEVNDDYEKNTGKVIIEAIKEDDPIANPAILCSSHGPFTFGKTPEEAAHNATVLEEVAKMAYYTEKLNKEVVEVGDFLLNKHYYRKHGKDAYYGQGRQK